MRILGATGHGLIDYAMVAILAAGPWLAGFSGPQSTLCWALAVAHFLLTAATRFPLGAAKLIGFPLHGAIEAAIAVLLLFLPWIANFAAGVRSRNFFLLMGLLLGITFVVTDYRGVRAQKSTPPETR